MPVRPFTPSGPILGSNPNDNRESLQVSRGYFVAIAGALCVFTVIIFFRQFFTSGFTLTAGDIGDTRFIIVILEHWRAVFHCQARFDSPDFFWPVQGVLGYSESLFLLALPYAFGRAIGLDPYISFEITLALFRALGFCSMLWLLRSFVGVSRSVALIGSVLFSLSNLYTLSMGHGQLSTLVYLPLLGALGCVAWRAHEKRRTLAIVCAGAFGFLFALVFFTSFYIGWFAILAILIALASAVLIIALGSDSLSTANQIVRSIVQRGSLIAIAFLIFSVAMIPFVLIYLPQLKSTGGRSFQDNLIYTSKPIDIINIGSENWLWGPTVDVIRLELKQKPMILSETQRGWPPFTLALFCVAALLALRRKDIRKIGNLADRRGFFLPAVLSVVFLAGLAISLKFGTDSSLWWFVYKFVPGGSAIRVPARFNLVLNICIVIVICTFLDELKSWRGRIWKVTFWGGSLFLVAEQINTTQTHLTRRADENAMLTRVRRPPSSCTSFFLANASALDRPSFANQIDAMLVARMKDLPTVNGYSGWEPTDWHLDALDSDYVRNLRLWVLNRKLTSGLCGLDLRDGSWTPTNLSHIPYLLSSILNFRTGGNAYLYETKGWGRQEEGGSWALGKRSVLTLDLPEQPTTDLLLTFKAHAFLPAQHPSFREMLLVDGEEVAQWLIQDQQIEKHVVLKRAVFRSPRLQIDFVDNDPKSPAGLGLSTDSRELGLAIEALKVAPVSSGSDYVLGSNVDFRWGGNAYLYKTVGWGEQEEGGSWALNGRSVLTLNVPKDLKTDLLLCFEAHAFVPPQRPHFEEQVKLNEKEIARWSITEPRIEKKVRIPRALVRSGLVRVEFVDEDPRSPAELGMWNDSRKLGLAIENLRLESASNRQGTSSPR